MKKIVLSLLVMCLTFVMINPLDVNALSTRGPSDEYYYCSAPKYTGKEVLKSTHYEREHYDDGIDLIATAVAVATNPFGGFITRAVARHTIKKAGWYNKTVKHYQRKATMSCDVITGTGTYVRTVTYDNVYPISRIEYIYN